MTTTRTPGNAPSVRASRQSYGVAIVRVLTTTDHKVIGKLYLGTSFGWFLVGGIMAMIMRSELAYPGQQVVNDELYNQLFTMHGTIMLLLFATPLFFGFANVIMPLQIGSPDVAFPRLNMLSYWLFLFGGLIAASGFLTPAGAADFGWFAYTPLSNEVRSPGAGGDLWIMGLWMAGLGTILGAVNFITTIFCMRAPGMTMFRMPIFVWNTLITSLLVLIAFPVLGGALLMLEADRAFGAHVFDTQSRPTSVLTTWRSHRGMDPAGPRNYQLLADALAIRLSADDKSTDKAIEAGRAWGHRLTAGTPSAQAVKSDDQATDQLIGMLGELGFSPQRRSSAAGIQIGLRHCPFLDLVPKHEAVICPVHLGLMQGAMAAMKANVTVERLEPFAEPNLCLAHLGSSSAT